MMKNYPAGQDRHHSCLNYKVVCLSQEKPLKNDWCLKLLTKIICSSVYILSKEACVCQFEVGGSKQFRKRKKIAPSYFEKINK